MSDYESKLKLYSLGIVVAAKERGSAFIKVCPIEEMPLANGKLSEQKITMASNTKSIKGVSKDAKLDGDLVLIAKWLPDTSGNRVTPPDVQPSETVILYKFADSEEYFWESREHNPGLRRLETVRFAFGNKPSGISAYDQDSSYWLEYSTHDKHIHLHTSKNNGEPYEYDIKLDTEKGVLLITDNAGNSVELDSSTSTLTATTNEQIIANTKVVIVNAATSCTVETATATVNASDSVSINTPTTNVSGNLAVGGGISVAKGGVFKGDIASDGVIAAGSTITAGGDIVAAGTISGANI